MHLTNSVKKKTFINNMSFFHLPLKQINTLFQDLNDRMLWGQYCLCPKGSAESKKIVLKLP